MDVSIFFIFFCSGREGESEAPERGGRDRFCLLKIPGEGGVVSRSGGRRVSVANRGIFWGGGGWAKLFFFRGRNVHQVLELLEILVAQTARYYGETTKKERFPENAKGGAYRTFPQGGAYRIADSSL